MSLQDEPRGELYKQNKLIATGSYGDIYDAMEKSTKQPLVLKRINKEAPLADNEGEVLSKLTHPHIIRLLDRFETDNEYILVLEKSPHGDLFDFLEKGPKRRLSENETRHIFKQLLSAVEYIHEQGYVHCDIKLENILLFETGAKLCDFGLAHPYRKGESLRISRGSMIYAAPEVIYQHDVEGPELDIWSLGVCLFALIFDCMPLNAEQNPRKCHENYRETGLQWPREINEDLKSLLRGMLECDKDKRFTLAEVLRHLWTNAGSDALSLDFWERK